MVAVFVVFALAKVFVVAPVEVVSFTFALAAGATVAGVVVVS